MNKYAVTIRATVTKTYEVEAESRDHAIGEAHDIFSVRCEEDVEEDYHEETLSVEKLGA